jgi:adenine-specific DNA-methyltransferase
LKRNKLELTWVGKDERPRIEPRVLVEDPALSYRAEGSAKNDDVLDNRLIFGDNFLALKALEQEFADCSEPTKVASASDTTINCAAVQKFEIG